jgi:hypothetical protein
LSKIALGPFRITRVGGTKYLNIVAYKANKMKVCELIKHALQYHVTLTRKLTLSQMFD